MNLIIITDPKKAAGQVPVLEGLLSELPSDRMYFRFPTPPGVSEDMESDRFKKKEAEIVRGWNEIRALVVPALEGIAKENGAAEDMGITCYLTTLGPYGYYSGPDEVFVNIWDAETGHVLETVVHEALHLILAGRLEGKTYEETEKAVDGCFLGPGLREVFPKYEAQDFE